MRPIDEAMLSEAIASRNIDQAIAALHGVKRLQVYLPKTKPEDIQVGRKFWTFDSDQMKWRKVTITYVRSGVAFFTYRKGGKEEIFYVDPWCKLFEPETHESDADPEYIEVVSKSGKTRITYTKSK